MYLSKSFEPREYQVRIAEAASSGNTLVVLPTGLGKTMVAVLVASRRLEKFPEGKVVVLAPTRPLAVQHSRTFMELMSFQDSECAVLTGTVDPGERELLWMRRRLFFATPQTVYNDARLGRIALKDVVLMVFDEAHRCVKDYTYTKLAKRYIELAANPLILGLTASPGGSKERVSEIKRNLFIDRVEARTEESEDVKGYVERTEIEPVRVRVPDEYQDMIANLREMFNDRVKKLREAGFIRENRVSKKAILEARGAISARLREAQTSGGQKGYIYGAIINQAQAVIILHALEVIETQGAATLAKYLSRLREKQEQGKAAQYLLKDPRWIRVEEEAARLRSVDHPKMSVLVSVVAEQLKKKESKVIVFTQYRDTIEYIVGALRAAGFEAEKFVGQSDRTGSRGMDQETQTRVLERFGKGEFSVLVSSSIGEEGLHVPDVDLVVFYEAVPSEIRYIQRRGRTGRTTEGRVIILLAEGTVDESYYYSSLFKEQRMKRLVSETGERQKRRGRNPTLLDFIS